MVKIVSKGITKRFGNVVACDSINIEVPDGKLFTLLGPSGCGKTTFLRIIAGFESPDEGRIFFNKQDITELQPYERSTGMVFQNYALWPHMNVFENIAYGLKVQKLDKKDIEKRVNKALDLVRLGGLGERTPFQLSGGQQQRVALARALVIEPKVLLLDEPLSNLDAKLRLEMRHEIMRIQRELGITAVYVTHDQEEALSISDRIAIMKVGKLQQIGTPQEIYNNPQSVFIADFIGQSTFLPGTIERIGKLIQVKLDVGAMLQAIPGAFNFKKRDKVICAIRPESFTIEKPKEKHNALQCIFSSIAFLGKSNRVYADIGDQKIVAELDPEKEFRIGQVVKLYVPIDEVEVFPLKD